MSVNEARSAASEIRQTPWPSPPDPGDLSRRLTTRRTELKLSLAQVAARAQVSQRYLEYLEKFPAQPRPSVLRRLAAALQTTPATLLGGLSRNRSGKPGRLERLRTAECVRLLACGTIGRVAFLAVRQSQNVTGKEMVGNTRRA